MKRTLSLILALVLCLSLCACSMNSYQPKNPTVPEKVGYTEVLTTENFDQFFDLTVQVEYAGLDYSGSKCKAMAIAYVDVTAKYTGTWDNIKADFVWEIDKGYSELMRDTWTFGNHSESRISFELPYELDGTEVGSINYKAPYETEWMDASDIRLQLAKDNTLSISNIHVENVSGIIVIEE